MLQLFGAARRNGLLTRHQHAQLKDAFLDVAMAEAEDTDDDVDAAGYGRGIALSRRGHDTMSTGATRGLLSSLRDGCCLRESGRPLGGRAVQV
jgi:hypothetical protein